MGTGDSLQDLRNLAASCDNSCVELLGFVSDEELQSILRLQVLRGSDPSARNDVSTWIKVMEYMAYAKPIVAFDLKETRFLRETLQFIQPTKPRLRRPLPS